MPPPTLDQLEGVFASVIAAVLTLAGAASVVMLLIGGFTYLTAGSDKDAAAKARGTLTYAVLGLVLTASAWMILSLFGTFLGVDLSQFRIAL